VKSACQERNHREKNEKRENPHGFLGFLPVSCSWQALPLRPLVQHDAPHALRQSRRVEVQQQTSRHLQQLQIRDQLRLMNRREPINGFDLDDNSILDGEIQSVAAV